MVSQSITSWLYCVTGAALACVASAAAIRAVAARKLPGLLRLFFCLPALILYCCVPFLFEVQSISRASAAAMLIWLATFKLKAFCLGRGPLTQPDLTLGQFTALLLWPIIPVLDSEGGVGMVDMKDRFGVALRRLFWRSPENLGVFLVGLYTLTHPAVPVFIKTYSAAFGVCAYCGLWANACAALVIALHGLDVAPSWDRPWLQTSLGDFWGRRWNLPASASLKHLVYEPLVEGRLVARSGGPRAARQLTSEGDGSAARAAAPSGPELAPEGPVDGSVAPARGQSAYSPARESDVAAGPEAPASRSSRRSGRSSASPAARLAGLAATFAVSGLMHEVLLCVCTGDTSQLGKQTLFFAIQAPLMLLEQQLVKAMKRAGVVLPNWLCIPVASLTLQIPAMYWFWGAYFAVVAPRAGPLASTPPAAVASQGSGVHFDAPGPILKPEF